MDSGSGEAHRLGYCHSDTADVAIDIENAASILQSLETSGSFASQ
jgi:hypothetical protein